MVKKLKNITRVRNKLRKEKETIGENEKGTLGERYQIYGKLKKILEEEANIYEAVSHEGTLNSVCCIRFLEKSEVIMEKLKNQNKNISEFRIILGTNFTGIYHKIIVQPCVIGIPPICLTKTTKITKKIIY